MIRSLKRYVTNSGGPRNLIVCDKENFVTKTISSEHPVTLHTGILTSARQVSSLKSFYGFCCELASDRKLRERFRMKSRTKPPLHTCSSFRRRPLYKPVQDRQSMYHHCTVTVMLGLNIWMEYVVESTNLTKTTNPRWREKRHCGTCSASFTSIFRCYFLFL